MRQKRAIQILLVTLGLFSLLWFNTKSNEVILLKSCYVHPDTSGYEPVKIRQVLEYGYKISYKEQHYEQAPEYHQEYILKADFNERYKKADCLEDVYKDLP